MSTKTPNINSIKRSFLESLKKERLKLQTQNRDYALLKSDKSGLSDEAVNNLDMLIQECPDISFESRVGILEFLKNALYDDLIEQGIDLILISNQLVILKSLTFNFREIMHCI